MLHGVYRGISASEVSVARAASMAVLRASLASKCAKVTSANSDVSLRSCEALWFDCSLPGVLALQWCLFSSIGFAECDLAIYEMMNEMTLWVLAGFLGDLGIDFFLLVIPSLTNADIVLIVASILAFPAEKW